MKSVRWLILLALLVTGTALVSAQDAETSAVADALNHPRGLFVDADETVYIAEGGNAGDETVEGQFGPVPYGPSARVVAVTADGEANVVLDGLTSAFFFEDYLGANDIIVSDGVLWVALGDAPLEIEGQRRVVAYDLATLEEVASIDTYAHEESENPDGDNIASNPTSIALADDGTLYIVDAGANSLLRWTEADGLSTFTSWTESPVPTSVAIDGEGNLVVGFLSGFPFPAQGSRLEVWSPEGELVTTYEGLTGVTDVAVAADGTIYAVELASGFGDLGWEPNSGRVVSVSADGVTEVAGPYNYPYGIALLADGTPILSVNAAYSEAGSGMVITVGSGMSDMPVVEDPAATPES